MSDKLKALCDLLRDRYDSIVVNAILELNPTDDQVDKIMEMIEFFK